MREIVFATGNELKVSYAERAFEAYGLEVRAVDIDLPEIQADSCEGIARRKARDAAERLNRPVIAADNGLFIDALNGFPGPYTKYAGKTIGPERILDLLEGVAERGAEIRYVLAYAEPEEFSKTFSHVTRGRIAEEMRGDAGLFVGHLFVPKEKERTLSELMDEDPRLEDEAWGDAEDRFAAWYVERRQS
jgi:XTP/dITP diphosphohydrolase